MHCVMGYGILEIVRKMRELKMSLFFLFLAAVFLVEGCHCLSHDRSNCFFIDTHTGCDSNPGTFGRPFKTLKHAKHTIRTVLGDGIDGDITVYLRAGTYYLKDSLCFDHRDSGKNGFQVTYRRYKDEPVNIISGRLVTQWQQYQNGIYKANVGKGLKWPTLFENDRWCRLARTPNTGYFNAAGGQTCPDGKSEVVFKQADIPRQFDLRDVRIQIWAGYHKEWDGGKNYDWYRSILPVRSIDWEKRTIYSDYKSWWFIHAHNRYFLENSLDFLDSPGEYYYDLAEGVLYYYPMTEPIDKQHILISTVDNLLCFKGKDRDHPVENITIEGLALAVTYGPAAMAENAKWGNHALIFCENARNITVKNCHLKNGGNNGISLSKFNQDHLITGNLIEDCGFSGITGGGYIFGKWQVNNISRAYINRGHVISNNHIRRGGQIIGHGSGIWFYETGDNEISHNLIEDMPRYGIILLGGSTYSTMVNPAEHGGYDGVIFGREVTWDNHGDFLFARDNRIIYNEIRNVLTDSEDGGAIYTWGLGKGNIISHNYVHDIDCGIDDAMYAGIYLDDASHDTKVTHNIISRLGGAWYTYPMCIKGVGVEITNNMIVDNNAVASVYILQTILDEMPETPKGITHERVDDLVLERNIISQGKGDLIYLIYPWKETIIASSDYNVFYHPGGQYMMQIHWEDESLQQWQSRLGGKYDRHSIIANPKLTSDFRLSKDSPALKLGFEPIDVEQIGLTKDFPEQFKK